MSYATATYTFLKCGSTQDLNYLCPGGPVGGLHLRDEKVLQEGETQPPHLLHPRVCDSDTRHMRFRLWEPLS